jgi:deoxycytidine triphosphate deaminase/cell division protein FtsB
MPDKNFDFAKTEDDALSRYTKHKCVDPFPHILPALLSSAQIQAYIAKTGMIFPYFPSDDPKKERITSASLIMTIGPEVLYWDSEDKQQYKNNLQKEESITFRPNSITFLRPAERFNLPDYIAARFNLRIVHVHRGLLLGTGPLIDPGFKGYPMIPVHNLTENEYAVRVGDDFINVEFTKIICDVNYKYSQKSEELKLPFKYKKNIGKTFDFDFTKYIDKNVPQRKVKSSLSSVIEQAYEVIRQQKKQVEDAKIKRYIYSIGSIVVAILAIATFIYAGYQLTISVTSIIDDARERIDITKKQEVKLDDLQKTVHTLQQEIQELKQDRKVNNTNNNENSSLRSQTEMTNHKSNGQIKTKSNKAEK